MKPMVNVSAPLTADKLNTANVGNLQNVTRWSSEVVVNSAGAGAAVVVTHDLGTVPTMLHVEPWVDSRWWADQDDRRVWSLTTVTFHVSAPTGRFSVRAGLW